MVRSLADRTFQLRQTERRWPDPLDLIEQWAASQRGLSGDPPDILKDLSAPDDAISPAVARAQNKEYKYYFYFWPVLGFLDVDLCK